MTEEQLATACRRMDQDAYLAGLKSVAGIENRRMRRVVNPSSYGEPHGRTVATARYMRDKARQRNRERILEAFKPGEAVSAAEIASRVNSTPRRIGGVLSWLAQNGHLVRCRSERWDGPNLWELRK